MDLSKLALSGLLGGALAVTAGCSGGEATTEEAPATEQAAPAAAEPKPAEMDHSKMDHGKMDHGKMKMDKDKMEGQMASAEIHDCAGKNACKGLGGCAVDEKKLAKLNGGAESDAGAEKAD